MPDLLLGRPPESSAHTPSSARREAFAYGAAFVPVFAFRAWEDVAEVIRNGWARRCDQVGAAREDWRLSWPGRERGLAGYRAASSHLRGRSESQPSQ